MLPAVAVTNAQFGFHYGQCAGQNIAHPHWHIVGSDWPQQDICPWCDWRKKQDYVFLENGSLVALLDGVRAGETVIVSRDHNWKWEGTEGEIATMLDQVVQLFRERFNGPDFIISSALWPNGHFWLSYTPILGQGGCDWVLAIRGMSAFTHPCAPEAMQSYLRTGQR